MGEVERLGKGRAPGFATIVLTACLLMTAVMSGIAGDSAADSGNFYAAAYCTKDGSLGVWGQIKVTSMEIYSGSVGAAFVNLQWTSGTWFQVGYVKGATNDGNTGSDVRMYYEYMGYTYDMQLLGVASLNTLHTFYIYNVLGTTQWKAVIDGTVVASAYFSSSTSPAPSAQAESHDTFNNMAGSFSSLQYGLKSSKGVKWTAWPDFTQDVDFPFTLTKLSVTSFSFGTDYTLVNDNFDDGNTVGWTIVNTAGGTCGVTTDRYYSAPYSLKLENPTTGEASATRAFSPQSKTLFVEARIMVDTTCGSEGNAYFYVGGAQVTIAFQNSIIKWYDDDLGWQTVTGFTPDIWYRIGINIFAELGHYDIYIDGTLRYSSANLRGVAPHTLGDVKFQAGWGTVSYGVTMWVDNVYGFMNEHM